MQDELEEEVPLQGDTPHARSSQVRQAAPVESCPQPPRSCTKRPAPSILQGQAASTSQQQDNYFGVPSRRAAQQEEPSRDHAVASYGQLLSPGSTWSSGFGRSEVETNDPVSRHSTSTATAGAGSSAPSNSSRAAAVQSSLQVAVLDPVQREEMGMLPGVTGKYMSYSVKTKTNRPGFRQQDFAVRRRFRDFVVSAKGNNT